LDTMQTGKLLLLSALVLVPVASPAASRHHGNARATTAKKPTKSKVIGQRGIDDERAMELQQALIKAGYLTGAPSGHWDSASEAAMGKLQADNGWQTKLVPDSRAIIKLGLGPNTTNAATAVAPTSDQSGSLGAATGLMAVR
jgi:hypothetical protein